MSPLMAASSSKMCFTAGSSHPSVAIFPLQCKMMVIDHRCGYYIRYNCLFLAGVHIVSKNWG